MEGEEAPIQGLTNDEAEGALLASGLPHGRRQPGREHKNKEELWLCDGTEARSFPAESCLFLCGS